MKIHYPVVVTTSWDDGHPLDLKLADLLSCYGIKGTFYICGDCRNRQTMGPPALRELSKCFEIGSHTRNHMKLTSLGGRLLREEIQESKTELENIIGKPVEVFAYPYGSYNSRVREEVIAAGFKGARTTEEFSVEMGRNAWCMPTTISV